MNGIAHSAAEKLEKKKLLLSLLVWAKSFCLNTSNDDAWVCEWYRATLILGTQTEMEWMGVKWSGGVERANRQKSCFSTYIPLKQQVLNRQAFPDILGFFYTCACMHSLIHRRIEEVWYGPVWKFYEIAFCAPPTVCFSIPLLSDSEKWQHCHSVLSPPTRLCMLCVAHSEWWIMWR